jgi:hypothetical protein
VWSVNKKAVKLKIQHAGRRTRGGGVGGGEEEL